MSVRLLTLRLVKHGRYFLQSYWKRDIHVNILEQNREKTRRSLPNSLRVCYIKIHCVLNTFLIQHNSNFERV